VPGFTQRYNVDRLVYYEHATSVEAAIARETQLKGWLRERKIELIERSNPGWHDLAEGLKWEW
jgi:putative endonuclease